MTKSVLSVIGILLVLMGVAGFTAKWLDQPAWYSIVQIIIGAIAIVTAVGKKN
jgi:hypothetical protein